jgi:hypothetical protein
MRLNKDMFRHTKVEIDQLRSIKEEKMMLNGNMDLYKEMKSARKGRYVDKYASSLLSNAF